MWLDNFAGGSMIPIVANGEPAKPTVDGDKLVIGGQTYTRDGKALAIGGK